MTVSAYLRSCPATLPSRAARRVSTSANRATIFTIRPTVVASRASTRTTVAANETPALSAAATAAMITSVRNQSRNSRISSTSRLNASTAAFAASTSTSFVPSSPWASSSIAASTDSIEAWKLSAASPVHAPRNRARSAIWSPAISRTAAPVSRQSCAARIRSSGSPATSSSSCSNGQSTALESGLKGSGVPETICSK